MSYEESIKYNDAIKLETVAIIQGPSPAQKLPKTISTGATPRTPLGKLAALPAADPLAGGEGLAVPSLGTPASVGSNTQKLIFK